MSRLAGTPGNPRPPIEPGMPPPPPSPEPPGQEGEDAEDDSSDGWKYTAFAIVSLAASGFLIHFFIDVFDAGWDGWQEVADWITR